MDALTYDDAVIENLTQFKTPLVVFNEFDNWYSVCHCEHKDGVKQLELGKPRNIVCRNCGMSMTLVANMVNGTLHINCIPWFPKKEWGIHFKHPELVAANNEQLVPSLAKSESNIVSLADELDKLNL